ncbi:MAG: carbon-nitrogen hydrolase family protein [Anaerolineae bacterium]
MAVLTLPNAKWEVEANLVRLRHWVRQAAERGADLVIAPEAYLDGYCLIDFYHTPPDDDGRRRYLSVAQEWPSSPALHELAAISRDCGVHLVCGGIERDGPKLYNTAFFFSPDGPLGRYHKTHIGWERFMHTPGDALPVWDTPWGRVGILICMDRQFPEATRSLVLQGAALIVVPSNGMHGGINDHMLMTRAYESSAYLAFAHALDGLIISPRGRVLAANEEAGREELVLCRIDLAHALEIRGRTESLLSERRPELYQRLVP